MPNIPTPIRAALGLAATAVDEARKLPETLPQAVTTVPLLAVSGAMQASLKLQQHLATLAARGDEVLSQLRGSSAEPPSWATFDESAAAERRRHAQPAKAAFDLIDYDNTGFAEGSEDEGKGRWDAVGVGGTSRRGLGTSRSRAPTSDPTWPRTDFDVTATPRRCRPDPPPAAELAGSRSPEPSGRPKRQGEAGAAKAAGEDHTAKEAGRRQEHAPAKQRPPKAGPAKASPAKAGPAKAAATKATAGRPKRAGQGSQARRRKAPTTSRSRWRPARPSRPRPPTPSTMAAEILHAHEAAADDE